MARARHGGFLALLLLTLPHAIAHAQSSVARPDAPTRAGRRSMMPRAAEIALARSAAPAGVTREARVLVFDDTAFVVADSGTNGVTCVVNRSWPASLEPHCFDAEGSATILPIELRRTMLFHRGRSDAQVEREIADGLAKGTFRLPRRPAMSYMMSASQQLIGDDGRPAGPWLPHVMIYYPFLTNAEVGLADTPDMKVGMVTDSGLPTASLMLIMPRHVDVAPAP
jgi:hypothetical protein